MKRRKTSRYYLPGVWIIAVVVLLMALLGYYAYSNYRHERDTMVAFLNREARMTVRALEAGMRTGMLGARWENGQLRRLLEETVRNSDVIDLRVLDQGGRLLMTSGGVGDLEGGEVLRRLGSKDAVAWTEDEGQVFVMAEQLDPFRGHGQELAGHGMMMRRWQDWCRMMRVPAESARQIVVVGLSAKDFLRAQQEDTRRAVGTGAVLLLLGGAAFYFLFVVQNSRAVSRALSQVKSYAQNVVESITNGVFSVDRYGRVASINGIACDMLGVEARDAVGQHYRDFISDGSCPLEPTIERGERILGKEVRCTLPSGGSLEVSVSASQLKNDEGEVLGAVAVMRNLKEIRQLEEQLRRSERLASMGRMAAGVAHELRNPLSTIRGFARFFGRRFGTLSEEGECSELLIAEVDRLDRIINDMLTFAQPRKLRLSAVDIRALVDHALLLCEAEIQQKAITVQRGLPAEIPAVQADKDLLVQVLVNLIHNAVQAMAENGELAVAAGRAEEAFEILVSDRGSGISEEARAHIFDPFFTTRREGTGLGLAIVHSIVQLHGGRIGVEPRAGGGTTFRVELPARG